MLLVLNSLLLLLLLCVVTIAAAGLERQRHCLLLHVQPALRVLPELGHQPEASR
jgi:hypothetical protein